MLLPLATTSPPRAQTDSHPADYSDVVDGPDHFSPGGQSRLRMRGSSVSRRTRRFFATGARLASTASARAVTPPASQRAIDGQILHELVDTPFGVGLGSVDPTLLRTQALESLLLILQLAHVAQPQRRFVGTLAELRQILANAPLILEDALHFVVDLGASIRQEPNLFESLDHWCEGLLDGPVDSALPQPQRDLITAHAIVDCDRGLLGLLRPHNELRRRPWADRHPEPVGQRGRLHRHRRVAGSERVLRLDRVFQDDRPRSGVLAVHDVRHL